MGGTILTTAASAEQTARPVSFFHGEPSAIGVTSPPALVGDRREAPFGPPSRLILPIR